MDNMLEILRLGLVGVALSVLPDGVGRASVLVQESRAEAPAAGVGESQGGDQPAKTSDSDCPRDKGPVSLPPEQVYDGVPFKPGESSTFEMRYFGALAGYGNIDVKSPELVDGIWHRKFEAFASTGDWYKLVFVAHDRLEAWSRPRDFGITRFYLEQDEGKMLTRPYRQKKWLEFFHDRCVVKERIRQPDKEERREEHHLQPGSIDALGVIFQLRTRSFTQDKPETALVYTSEKNWVLEALPVAFETIEVPAGQFKTVKLKLTTYLGKELQQRGDLYAWLDVATKERPLVKMEGNVKIGAVTIKLKKFIPGNGS